MNREDKVISLDLAKQIDQEHKRLGIEVESEWWWWDGTGEEHELIQDDSLAYRDRQELDIHGYPAYDCAELGEMLPKIIDIDDNKLLFYYEMTPNYTYINYKKLDKQVYAREDHIEAKNCEVEARGRMYLWLLKEGYIKEG